MQANYRTGDLVTYRVFGDTLRTVRVTRRVRDIKNGRAGFDGMELVNGRETGADCWGYDDQIEAVEAAKTPVQAKAATLWAAMDKNERCGVRFGMFPAVKMREAEKEGFDGRALCVALCDCAKADGGMRA